MDFLMDLGAGWLIGLVLGMMTGLVASLVLLKDSHSEWVWVKQKEKE